MIDHSYCGGSTRFHPNSAASRIVPPGLRIPHFCAALYSSGHPSSSLWLSVYRRPSSYGRGIDTHPSHRWRMAFVKPTMRKSFPCATKCSCESSTRFVCMMPARCKRNTAASLRRLCAARIPVSKNGVAHEQRTHLISNASGTKCDSGSHPSQSSVTMTAQAPFFLPAASLVLKKP